MAVTHRTVVEGVLAAAVVLIASVPSARAEHAPRAHVRTWDVPAQRLVRYALRQSLLTRQLADRLQRSDVFVYVGYDCELPDSLMGRLSFMAFAPGVRYVSVHLSCKAPLLVQLAALGHELRHAVEIAEDPSVVDDASLLDSYRRIGFQ